MNRKIFLSAAAALLAVVVQGVFDRAERYGLPAQQARG